MDGNISQVIDINIDIAVSDDENDIFTFLGESISITIEEGKKGDSFYTQSYPNFNEAINWIISQNDADQFVSIIDKVISEQKDSHQHKTKSSNHIYIFIFIFIFICIK